MDLFTPREGVPPGTIAELREWSRTAAGLDEDALVTVAELACHEPGCPPVETVVMLAPVGGPTSTLRFHRPATDVTRADVERAITTTQE